MGLGLYLIRDIINSPGLSGYSLGLALPKCDFILTGFEACLMLAVGGAD